MRFGLISGALWGLDTVILGIALAMAPFVGGGHAALSGAVLHDVTSALILLAYMAARGRLRDTLVAVRTRSGRAVIIAALLGGPVGMTGYLLAISNIGPAYTAITSTFYPAAGTVLAFFVLGERMRPRQVIALVTALAAIIVIGWSSSRSAESGSALIGVLGAVTCVLGWGSEAVLLTWGMREETIDNETALQIRQTTSALVYVLVVAPLGGALGLAGRAVASPATALVALAALAGSASYLFYYRALGTIGASRGMALNISYSAWAVLFALLLQGTVPTPVQLVCCAVILAGTVLAATPRWSDLWSRPSQPSSPATSS